MTTCRRLLMFAFTLAGVVALVLGVLAVLPARPGVSKANFERIEEGMTLAELKTILGEPSNRDMQVLVWDHVDGSYVVVWLDERNKVEDKRFHPSTESLTDKVLRWLGMQPRLETRALLREPAAVHLEGVCAKSWAHFACPLPHKDFRKNTVLGAFRTEIEPNDVRAALADAVCQVLKGEEATRCES